MQLEIDADVKAVAEFMQENVAAAKLVGIAESLRDLAPILWGHFDREAIRALELRHPVANRSKADRSGSAQEDAK